MLICNTSWSILIEMHSFSDVVYLNGNSMLPAPPSFDSVLYFGWQRRCTFSIEEPDRVQRHCLRGTWGARLVRTLPKHNLLELLVLNRSLLTKPRLSGTPFESDLWQVCLDWKARYTARLLETKDVIKDWPKRTKVDVAQTAMLGEEWLLHPEYGMQKKEVMLFWPGFIPIEQRAPPVHGYFIGWDHLKLEVSAHLSASSRSRISSSWSPYLSVTT